METWVWLCKSKNGSDYVNGWKRCRPADGGCCCPVFPRSRGRRQIGLLTGPSQVEEGGADNYCSLNSTINISSAVFVLTTPVRSLTLVSKVSCCFQLLDRGELGQAMLMIAKGPESLHGRSSWFGSNSALAKLHISLLFVLVSAYIKTLNIISNVYLRRVYVDGY